MQFLKVSFEPSLTYINKFFLKKQARSWTSGEGAFHRSELKLLKQRLCDLYIKHASYRSSRHSCPLHPLIQPAGYSNQLTMTYFVEDPTKIGMWVWGFRLHVTCPIMIIKKKCLCRCVILGVHTHDVELGGGGRVLYGD